MKLVSGPAFARLLSDFEKDIITEDTFLEVFECLNREELDADRLRDANQALSRVVQWVRAVVSYHVLVHPYKVRNLQTVPKDSELFPFLETVDSFMDQFYQLKAFLVRTKVLPRDTNFAFNLSHVKFIKRERTCPI